MEDGGHVVDGTVLVDLPAHDFLAGDREIFLQPLDLEERGGVFGFGLSGHLSTAGWLHGRDGMESGRRRETLDRRARVAQRSTDLVFDMSSLRSPEPVRVRLERHGLEKRGQQEHGLSRP